MLSVNEHVNATITDVVAVLHKCLLSGDLSEESFINPVSDISICFNLGLQPYTVRIQSVLDAISTCLGPDVRITKFSVADASDGLVQVMLEKK